MQGMSIIGVESNYTYSEPVIVKKWPGGKVQVQVGYVRKHPEQNCIVLSKEWPAKGGLRQEKFNIKNGEDWQKIKKAIEELWPELEGDATADDIKYAITKASQETQLLELLATYPDILTNLPTDVDILKLPAEQKASLQNFLKVGGAIAAQVMTKLAEESIDDLSEFVRVLEQLRLSAVNSLVSHVQSRISFIELFEKAIHNNESYERRGPDSIHNLLKANIWMLDRNYTILHDDTTLKNILLQQTGVADGDNLNQRPDFLCLSHKGISEEERRDVVIVEIKRPSHTLKYDNLNQLMQYRSILQKHSGSQHASFTGYLVGRTVSDDLQLNDLRASGFHIKTYTDFIQEARSFYSEYLKIVEQEQYAI